VTRKVLAYITRERGGETQLLVFEHADHPDAGVQVPRGTVEPGETLESAARREVREEAGLTMLDGLEFIGAMTQAAFGAAEEWNFFALRAEGIIADCEAWTHRVQGKGEDEGTRFRYYWVALNPGLELAGRQHVGFRFLKELSTNLRESSRIEKN
jgi:ADP-ribose pyrophosphatase YjhB (NUDIX family)